jgi:hypothetical protein
VQEGMKVVVVVVVSGCGMVANVRVSGVVDCKNAETIPDECTLYYNTHRVFEANNKSLKP